MLDILFSNLLRGYYAFQHIPTIYPTHKTTSKGFTLMMQRKNKPVTVDIDTHGSTIPLYLLLMQLARTIPPIPIDGHLRFTITHDGRVSVTGKGVSA